MRRFSLCTLSTSAFAALALSLVGCGSDDPVAPLPENAGDAVTTYAQIVLQSYEDSAELADDMDSTIQGFANDSDEDGLEDAKDAWLASREPYLQTEVYRFYNGPIDHEPTGDEEAGPEGQINAWPLDEAYIDYVEGDADAGIINDTEETISEANLIELNASGGDENVSTGYHAIEFLLWGQDLTDPIENMPGQREYTDYTTADNFLRRRDYLTTVSGLLVKDLNKMVDAWEVGDDENYRAEFETVSTREALRRILTGMIVLTRFEVRGERLLNALNFIEGEIQQENEHSCFSDNTHQDFIGDIQGISNVWYGTYTALNHPDDSIDGTGIRDVVAELDLQLAMDLDAAIDDSLDKATSAPQPFDYAIDIDNTEDRAELFELVEALEVQGDLLEDVFRLFDLEVPAT